MDAFANAIWPLLFLAYPLLAYFLCRRSRLLNWLGPVVLAYAGGILLGNLPGLSIPKPAAEATYQAAIALALPLLLFNADFFRWLRTAGSAITAYALAVLSTLVAATVAGLSFGMADSPRLMGMMTGAATGGTVNLTSVGTALQVPPERLAIMNMADILGGAFYLLLLVSVFHHFAGRFLRPYPGWKGVPASEESPQPGRRGVYAGGYVQALLAAAVALGLSVAAALGIDELAESLGWVPATESLHMSILLPVTMLGLTTSGIMGSFVPPLRSLAEAARLGDYLVIVFCVGIGSQVDLANLRPANLELIGLGLSIIYGAIVLHYILCWLAGIDRDTAIIASAAAILSPPLLGPVAERLGNRQVLISGLTTGVVGYALGTYLGIALANLIEAVK